MSRNTRTQKVKNTAGDFENKSAAHPHAGRHASALPQFNPTSIYEHYLVTVRFRARVFGGVPKNPDLIEAWIKARTGHDDEITQEQIKEAKETQEETVEMSGMWTGFPSDERGIFLQARQIKALFRESSTLLLITTKKRGSKQIIQHGFEVKGTEHEARIYFHEDDGAIITAPDGYEEGPIHVTTARGPRTSLKRQDYVECATVSFLVWVLKTDPREKRHLTSDDLVQMLTHAQENGLGASRSQGHGKFDVIGFERTDTPA